MSDLFSPLVEGNLDSHVRVVIYEDLQCPDCKWLRRKLDDVLLPKYGRRVGFEHREFPLPHHSWARAGAIAARYFQRISVEAGVGFRRETMANINNLTPDAIPAWVAGKAKQFRTDPKPAVEALEDARLAAAVEADYHEGLSRSVKKTPTVFVGETSFIEWVPMEELMRVLDAALAVKR